MMCICSTWFIEYMGIIGKGFFRSTYGHVTYRTHLRRLYRVHPAAASLRHQPPLRTNEIFPDSKLWKYKNTINNLALFLSFLIEAIEGLLEFLGTKHWPWTCRIWCKNRYFTFSISRKIHKLIIQFNIQRLQKHPFKLKLSSIYCFHEIFLN